MHPTTFASRFLAAFLILVLSLPNPALALRSGLEEKVERELADQLEQALAPSLDLETRVGMIHTVRLPVGGSIEGREARDLVKFITRYPFFTGQLGMTFDAEKQVLQYPNVAALNARIRRLRGTPNEVFTSFVEVPGEIRFMPYARHWANGQMVLAKDGKTFWHDHGVHLPAFLTFPRELVEASRRQMTLLIELFDDPLLKASPTFHREVRAWIYQQGKAIEFASTTWSATIEGGRKNLNVGEYELEMCQSARSLGDRLFPTHRFTTQQRARLKRIIDAASSEGVTGERIQQLYRQTQQRLALERSASRRRIAHPATPQAGLEEGGKRTKGSEFHRKADRRKRREERRRITRRDLLILGGLTALTAGGHYLFSTREEEEPAEEAIQKRVRARMEKYFMELAGEWKNSSDPMEKRWATFLPRLGTRLRVVKTGSSGSSMASSTPIGVSLQHKKDGNFMMNPETGYPEFTLFVNGDVLESLLSDQSFDRSLRDLFLKSLIVKELGGIEHYRDHPGTGRAYVLLRDRLQKVLRRYRGSQGRTLVPRRELKDSPLAKLLKYFTANVLVVESAGYVKQLDYLDRRGLSAAKWKELFEKRSQGNRLLGPGVFSSAFDPYLSTYHDLADLAGPGQPDRLWRAAVLHLLTMMELEGEGAVPEGLLAVVGVFRLAVEMEAEEGRAKIATTGKTDTLFIDPHTKLPPPRFMEYLRDERFYAPSPMDLEREFGKDASVPGTKGTGSRAAGLEETSASSLAELEGEILRILQGWARAIDLDSGGAILWSPKEVADGFKELKILGRFFRKMKASAVRDTIFKGRVFFLTEDASLERFFPGSTLKDAQEAQRRIADKGAVLFKKHGEKIPESRIWQWSVDNPWAATFGRSSPVWGDKELAKVSGFLYDSAVGLDAATLRDFFKNRYLLHLKRLLKLEGSDDPRSQPEIRFLKGLMEHIRFELALALRAAHPKSPQSAVREFTALWKGHDPPHQDSVYRAEVEAMEELLMAPRSGLEESSSGELLFGDEQEPRSPGAGTTSSETRNSIVTSLRNGILVTTERFWDAVPGYRSSAKKMPERSHRVAGVYTTVVLPVAFRGLSMLRRHSTNKFGEETKEFHQRLASGLGGLELDGLSDSQAQEAVSEVLDGFFSAGLEEATYSPEQVVALSKLITGYLDTSDGEVGRAIRNQQSPNLEHHRKLGRLMGWAKSAAAAPTSPALQQEIPAILEQFSSLLDLYQGTAVPYDQWVAVTGYLGRLATPQPIRIPLSVQALGEAELRWAASSTPAASKEVAELFLQALRDGQARVLTDGHLSNLRKLLARGGLLAKKAKDGEASGKINQALSALRQWRRGTAGPEEIGRPEIPTDKRAVIFGGLGHIGRGYIAPLLAMDDFDLILADVNESLLSETREREFYTVKPVGPGGPVEVRNFWGVDASQPAQIAALGPRADWIFTSVGANNITKLTSVIYGFIRNRMDAGHLETLNIVFAENLPIDQPQIAALRKAVLEKAADPTTREYIEEKVNFIGASEQFEEYVDGHVGWVGAVVHITIPPTIAAAFENPLDVQVEGGGPYPLEVDAKELRNTSSIPSGLRPVQNIRASREKKLLIHNMGHAALAYLASASGINDPAKAIEDPRIKAAVLEAMRESAQGFHHRYPDLYDRPALDGYIDGLIKRFGNRELNDTVERIARDPLRKLGEDDRLFGAAISAKEAGVDPKAITLALYAAIRYAKEVDHLPAEQLVPVMELVRKHGLKLPEDDTAFSSELDRLSAGLEERVMAREVARAAWKGVPSLIGDSGRVANRLVVIENPGFAVEGVLAVQQGFAVAFNFDGPIARGLEKLLAQLPDSKGPYAIGTAQVARLLQEYPADSQLFVTSRRQILALVGLEEYLPESVAYALQTTRTWLDLSA